VQPYAPPGYSTGGYPGAPGYPYDAQGRPLSDKSKVVAGVLGIALGGFGVGRFYTGHVGIGVAQLAVTLVTCGLGHFWGLIDGIMILVNGGTDAQGRVLRD
jgi:TM2 domain-containing membrane protein YozV